MPLSTRLFCSDEAEVALAFFDELHDQILTHYEQQIVAMHMEMLEHDQQYDDRQQPLPLEEDDQF